MQNKNLLSSLTGKLPQFHLKLTRTKLYLFALTLIAVGFALGGLESGDDNAAIANKVVSLNLPDRHDFQVPPIEGVSEIIGDQAALDIQIQGEQWDKVTVR